jgi:hypothetical protein
MTKKNTTTRLVLLRIPDPCKDEERNGGPQGQGKDQPHAATR